jgi:hypothetical protein
LLFRCFCCPLFLREHFTNTIRYAAFACSSSVRDMCPSSRLKAKRTRFIAQPFEERRKMGFRMAVGEDGEAKMEGMTGARVEENYQNS